MAKPNRKKNMHKMPEPMPLGEILTDNSKEEWELGPSIGKGGFGEIYSAKRVLSEKSNVSYVIKIEPHNNGPLFVEMHFYMRNCKKDDVDEYMKSKQLKTVGIPYFYGSGSHEYKGEKYRFVVIERFGTDIWKIFQNNGKSFPLETVLKLGVQIIDILEYIHSKGYIHGDIKGANLLIGSRSNNLHQVYLLDYGLAGRYFTGKVYKPDPKKAHNGTIEYLSVDAHEGVQTRRGDLEILLYNLIQWLGCKLPWEDKLTDVKHVHQSKEKYLKDVPEFMSVTFKNEEPPGCIIDYLNYLNTLNFDTEPDYEKLKTILTKDLKAKDFKLMFNMSTKRKAKPLSPVRKPKRSSKSLDRTKPVRKARVTKKKNVQNGDLKKQEPETDEAIKSNDSPSPPIKTKVTNLKKKLKRLSKSMDDLNGAALRVTRARIKTSTENDEVLTAEMLKYKKKLDGKKKLADKKNNIANKTEKKVEDSSSSTNDGKATVKRRAARLKRE